MGWSLATIWWVAAGVLVAVELATGSFYLLMLALGAAAAAIAAHLGFGINTPEAAAAVAEFADAVIVGSALVKRIAALAAQPDKINAELGGFIQELRHAMDKTGVAA